VDLMQARVAFRERSLLDVVDLAVRFLAANAKPYALLAASTIVPAFAVCWGVARAAGWIFGWIAALVLASLVDASFVELASKLVFSQRASVRDAIRTTAALLPRLLLVRALQGVGLAFSLVLGGVPWLWLGSIFLFLPEVVVLERSKVAAACGRAPGLAMVRLGAVTAAVILLSVLPVGAALVADVAGREILETLLEIRPPKSMFTEGGSALALLGFWLALPLRATARFFVYLDVRTRIEGWDIQTRFAALAARAAAATAAALVAFGVLVMLPARTAHAAPLDPAKAETAVDATMRARGYAFCRDPEKPLSEAARALCPHAEAIPDCEGLRKACSDVPDEELSWLKRFSHWLAAHAPSWLRDVLMVLAKLPGFAFLAAVGVAIVVAAIAVVRSVRAMRRGPSFQALGERAPLRNREEKPAPLVTTDEEALLAQAGDRARQGENDAALQLYLAAALRALDRRGAVRWARDRTNGEYVRSCLEAPSREPLRAIVREVDHAQFGRIPATETAVTRAAALASGIVRWTPAVLLVLILPAIAGCSSLHAPRAGADPAGQDLFVPWLRQQGMDVASLDAPLEDLEATRDGRSRAVVIDAETTPLDDETKTHLETWVAGGGTLVLAGAPAAWPKAFGAKDSHCERTAQNVTARASSPTGGPRSGQTSGEGASFTGNLARPASMKLAPAPAEPGHEDSEGSAGADVNDDEDDDVVRADSGTVAWLEDGSTYAAVEPLGHGAVIGIASDELLTNAGLARRGNAAVLAAVLAYAGTSRFAVAEPEDGSAPASSPIAALIRSGLGLALLQAAVAAALLFAAAGVRMVAPRPTAPPSRRGFVEHIVAAGALYATAGAARHVLTAYTRFLEQRLRAQMPRGTTRNGTRNGAHDGADFAAFLSARSGFPAAECANLWSRAVAATHTAGQGNAEDLRILQSLYEVHSAIARRDP
jgi:hypothetical protein